MAESRRVQQDDGVKFLTWRMRRAALNVNEDAAARDLVQMLGQDLYQVNRACEWIQVNANNPNLQTNLQAYNVAYRAANDSGKAVMLPEPTDNTIKQWDDLNAAYLAFAGGR